ncbi:response regulator [soil metagenome]
MQPHVTQDIVIATEKENDLLEMLLSTDHHDLVLLLTGQDVLAYLREKTPALLLIDAHLADISGITICSRVKKVARLQALPFVLLVAAKDTASLKEAELCRADALITKPLGGKDIRATVARLLGKKTLSDGLLDLNKVS